MTQYTDADLTITVKGIDLNNVHDVHITLKQGNVVLDLYENSISLLGENTIVVFLPQDQTALFTPNDCIKIQMNYFDESNHRHASAISTIRAESNLLRRILTNE